MSLIHKALEYGNKETETPEKKVSKKDIALEEKLTSPTLKWLEMYNDLDEEARTSKKPKKTPFFRDIVVSQAYLARIMILVGVVVAIAIFVASLTVFNFFHIQPANPSFKAEMVPAVVATPQQLNRKSLQAGMNAMAPAASFTPNFVLSGIIEGKERMALINDRVVGVGDYVGNALVTDIQGKRVILDVQGKEVYLVL